MSHLPANWRELPWALNIYVCEHGTSDGRAHVMTTVDVDGGVTPFLTSCPTCKGRMRSMCYPSARPVPAWVPEPTVEWFKPSRTEMRELKLDDYTLEHIFKGGLITRPWTGKTPVHNPDAGKAKGPAFVRGPEDANGKERAS